MKRMWSRNELLRMNDAQIRTLIESGEIDNAKPIYCHPILVRYAVEKLMLTCLIFNNDSTPFTLDTFKAWLDDVADNVPDGVARVMVSGSYTYGLTEKTAIASYLYKIKASSEYGIGGIIADGSGEAFVQSTNFNSVIKAESNFYDGVNKIN